ncbi:MAG: hypothetical protein AB8G95_12265 [Anaerolineae bacterium]
MKDRRLQLKLPNHKSQQIFLFAAAACIVTLLTYGRTLWLPFFFDDLVQLPFVDRYTLAQHWAGSNESPYYRPLVISIWKVETLLFGRHLPVFQHGLNLVFHCINACLTGVFSLQMVDRLNVEKRSNFLFGLLVLTLYLLYPFHHQAIPWPGALFHILVTTFILAALIAYLNDRLIAALIFAFLAPFTHENGVVVPALIFLIIGIRCFFAAKLDWRQLIGQPLLFAFPAGAWLIVRSLVATSRDAQTLFPGFESIGQSGTWFFQGLTWPGAILSRGLLSMPGFNDLGVVWLVGALSILLALVICYRAKTSLLLLALGAGWWLIASAPAMLVLPFGYIFNSPRLLSLAGCGVAIFWGSVIWQLVLKVGSFRQNQFAAGLALFLLVVFGFGQWVGITQILESNRYHTMLGDAYRQATSLASHQTAADAFPVFINFPSSMAPRDKYFPLGNEGAVFWPGYAPQHTIVTTNDNQIETINQQFVQADAIRSDQPYLYGIVRPTGQVEEFRNQPAATFYNTVYSENSISIFPAGNWSDSGSGLLNGTFIPDSEEFKIELLNRSFGQSHSNGQDFYNIGFSWQAAAGRANDVTVFVHAVNAAGELVSQSDGDPLVGLAPLSVLNTDEALHDIRTIPADPAIVAFRVGLYNRVTGERIPFYGADGQRAADDMYIFEVEP